MDDLKMIKEQIYVNNEIETLLSALGCEHIKQEQGGDLVVATLPHGNNKRSVQIKVNESLTSYIRSKGIIGDIYSVVGYILYGCVTFKDLIPRISDIKKFVCETLEYTEFLQYDPKRKKKAKDPNSWLKDIKKKRKKQIPIEGNEILDESIMEQYLPYFSCHWRDEGISYLTQWEFGVKVDDFSKRIVFPIRDRYGRLIGVKGRYIGSNQYILDQKKYMYLYPCNKSIELFNLHRALPFIMDKKEIIVFESEKSVMLSWQYGFKNAVSIGGDGISDIQVKLIRDLGLDIVSVFAWDKDKDEDFIIKQLERLKGRSVYAILDERNLLKEKQSPVDMGLDTWYSLYQARHQIY